MPPRGVKSAKRARQYEHIKDSERARGVGEDRAEEIAARTVNKQRAQSGETKGSRKKTTGAGKKSAATKRSSSGGGAKRSAAKRATKKR